MKTNIIINRLKDLRDKGECVSETMVLDETIKRVKTLTKIRDKIQQEITDVHANAFKSNYSNLYYDGKVNGLVTAKDIIDKYLEEVENDR